MGPEIMSYGAGSGEPYVSDLTLAFLEDSGIYAANYSAVRPLIVPTADDLKKNKLQFLQQEGHAIEGYTPPARSPGALRWGKGEGCAFVFGSVAQWGDQARPLGEGYQRYTCDGNPETMYGCTADNKMSAVCSVETFRPDNPAMRGASGKRSCNIDPFTRQETCVASDRGAAYLPSAFGYFGDPSKGSFGAAMDFVPFRAGYWNCQEKQMKADNDMGEGRTGFGLNRLAGDTEANMKLFGGQAHCPECRCFISSCSFSSSCRGTAAHRQWAAGAMAPEDPANCIAIGPWGHNMVYEIWLPSFSGPNAASARAPACGSIVGRRRAPSD